LRALAIAVRREKAYRISLNHFALDLSGRGLVMRDGGSLWGAMGYGKRIGSGAEYDQAPLRIEDNECGRGGRAHGPRGTSELVSL
jgi:hypothetical protein